jgi:hypothetical protein
MNASRPCFTGVCVAVLLTAVQAALPLGVFAPRAGRYTLRLEVTGANPAATGAKYLFGLDCVELIKP